MSAILLMILAVFGTLILRAIFALPAALLIMWCWNGSIPALFHLPEIRYWQSFALCLLVGFITAQTGLAVSKKE